MFTTIVVGHDGTPAADRALRLAELLGGEDARLIVARVARAADAAHAANELVTLVGDRCFEICVRTGRSVEHALSELALEEEAELIVVGSDRRRGDHRAHSVRALRLLNGAPCAVAIAPADGEPGLHHIGVAYDGSAEAELALEAAYDLASRSGAAVSIYLAVLPDVTDDLTSLLEHREAYALLDAAADRAPEGVNPETVVVTGYASAALAGRASGIVDLVVVGSRRQGPLRRVLLGSTSRELTLEVDCAVLVTPRGTRRRVAATS
jgi:nucleotide-binding universal stress UspA family protein